MNKRGGGGEVTTFSVEKFLSNSVKNIRRGTLLCWVSDIFRYRISLWIRGVGGVSRFSVENFSSHIAENFCSAIL